MPIMFSYNFTGGTAADNNRMQSMFERFGWQNVGGSCYRYPALNAGNLWPEDWFNKVIPALMCFRAYALKHNLQVPKFSLDANVSTGHDSTVPAGVGVGDAPRTMTTADFAMPGNNAMGAGVLETWLQSVTNNAPY